MSVVTSRGSLQRAGATGMTGAAARAPPDHQHQRPHQRGAHAAAQEPQHGDMAHPPPCKECSDDISEMELHAEIEHLKRHLAERDAHIEAMESEFLKGNTRISELEEQIVTWREKYDRLYDSHRRVQRVNQNLEEKLLQMADKCTEDKSQLTRDVETLSVRLAESNCTIGHLHKENERYKNDMNLAIQLLQCKPDNFVSQKFDSLPPETQARVSSYIMSKAKLNQDVSHQGVKNASLITEKVNPDDFEFNISASLMSKILEESVQNTISSHCDTCTCMKKSINPFSFNKSQHSISTQTVLRHEKLNAVCFSCKSDINSLNSSVSGKCNSPLSVKIFSEEKDLIQMSDTEKSSSGYSINQNQKCPKSEQVPSVKNLKSPEENAKLVSQKHREIMSKIGEELKQIGNKERFAIPALEPITGHHRLCDRTKNGNPEISTAKFDDGNNATTKNSCNNSSQSFSINKQGLPANVADITFGEIENSVMIPNTAEVKNDMLPTKADLNSITYKKAFHGSSVSSNDAESKTSSNKSYQHGSNNKVHIGPGPRFCSLIMQAGSKNILLDNAQPNIAPVLYTRQSKHVESSTPLTTLYNTSPLDVPLKHNTSIAAASDHLSEFIASEKKSNGSNVNSRLMDTVDTILDLPNDDIVLKNPIDLIEKPESGYKSNESAEIIDKLLFNVDNVIPVDPNENMLHAEAPLENNAVAAALLEVVINENSVEKDKAVQSDIDILFGEKKTPNDNLKMFNFDNYEKSLKLPTNLSIQKDNSGVPILNELEPNKIINESHTFINEGTELFNSNFDLKIASKNLSEINKKFQILSENTLETQKAKEWKKETSTEKSSSSLSSDDSAVVLQKQQLIRVAEWVQKNLEMEQQIDFDNSDSCHQSAEEMHHVRNDFPRPAKVDHRIRNKNNLKTSHKTSHHSSKHSFNIKVNDNTTNAVSQTCNNEEMHKDNRLSYSQDYNMINFNIDCTDKEKSEVESSNVLKRQQSLNLDSKIPRSECPEVTASNCTTKLYTKEELARMEYNVKQFLLNGTRWTKNPNEPIFSRARRTSSKTETDL